MKNNILLIVSIVLAIILVGLVIHFAININTQDCKKHAISEKLTVEQIKQLCD